MSHTKQGKMLGIDPECQALCQAINSIVGIQTTSSCCGHGKTPFRIWFCAENLSVLPELLHWFDGCHCGFCGWRVNASTDCAKNPVSFCVEGPAGKTGHQQANRIAELIIQDQAAIAATMPLQKVAGG